MGSSLKSVRLDNDILKEIAPLMKKKKMSFSAFVQESIKTFAREIEFKESVENSYGAWSDKAHPGLKAGSIAYINKTRGKKHV